MFVVRERKPRGMIVLPLLVSIIIPWRVPAIPRPPIRGSFTHDIGPRNFRAEAPLVVVRYQTLPAPTPARKAIPKLVQELLLNSVMSINQIPPALPHISSMRRKHANAG